MRATEALWLADPKTDFNAEAKSTCMHLSIERNAEVLKQARRENERMLRREIETRRREGWLF